MLVSLHPVLDRASHEHLLLLRQPVRTYAAVEGHAGRRPEGRREVLPIAVDVAKIEIQHTVALGQRRRRRLIVLRLAKMIRAAGLKKKEEEDRIDERR